jgi:hypothetical protein
VVEELFPASVAVMAEVDVYEGVVFRLDRLSNKLHLCVFWSSAAFLDIAGCTGTNNILPDSFASHTPWYDVVER